MKAECVTLTEDKSVCLVNGTNAGYQNGVLIAKSEVLMAEEIQYAVRRLTPLEAERLQGFPDGWTDIPEFTDEKGKKRKTKDSHRYRALGNSIALPPWRWVLSRISEQYAGSEEKPTMASLFDGIGGFPLIWQEINGDGTCIWASEIEPFCVSLTKERWGNLKL